MILKIVETVIQEHGHADMIANGGIVLGRVGVFLQV